jgi:hypothetical protein
VADVVINEEAVAELVHEVADVVIAELARDVADTARAIAPVRVRHGPIPPWVHHPKHPGGGELKASVTVIEGETDDGMPYADVAALYYGRFLDPKAEQMHRLHPFLPTALYTEVDGREFYF